MNIISNFTSPDSIVEQSSTAPEIFLDDVHKALSTLQSSSGGHKNGRESKDIASLTKQLAHATALLGKRNERELQAARSEDEKKAKRTRVQSLKARTNCNACGKKGHWAGDKQCELRDKGRGKGRDKTHGSADHPMGRDEGNNPEKTPFQRRGQ